MSMRTTLLFNFFFYKKALRNDKFRANKEQVQFQLFAYVSIELYHDIQDLMNEAVETLANKEFFSKSLID